MELRGYWCGTEGCFELRAFWYGTEGFWGLKRSGTEGEPPRNYGLLISRNAMTEKSD